MDKAAYSAVSQAHDAKRPVVMTGDLVRVKQRWQLTNASVCELPADDADEDEDPQ